MGLSDSPQGRASVMSFRRPLVACASTLQGLPGSTTDLSTRAVPSHPGRPGECKCLLLPHRCFQGFILRGGLAAFVLLTRPNRVYSITAHVFAARVLASSITGTHARLATC
jgi:hypothetical protein